MEALYYDSTPLYEAFDEMLLLYENGSCNDMRYFIESGNDKESLLNRIIETLKTIWNALKKKVRSLLGKVDEDSYIEVSAQFVDKMSDLTKVDNELHLLNKEITKGDADKTRTKVLGILGIVAGIGSAAAITNGQMKKVRASEVMNSCDKVESISDKVIKILDNIKGKFKENGVVSFLAEKLKMISNKLEKIVNNLIAKIIKKTPETQPEQKKSKLDPRMQETLDKTKAQLEESRKRRAAEKAMEIKESSEIELFMFHLYKANEVMESYVEFDEIEFLFEAEAEQVKNDLIQKNNDTVSTSKGHFMKAIDALISLIQNAINAIGDFMRKLVMSKEDRDAFESFKQKCLADPKLKDKKILVKDFRRIQAEYTRVMKRAENELKRAAQGEQADIDGAIGDLEKYMNGLLKGTGTAVGMEFALNVASGSSELAQQIYDRMCGDKEAMKALRKNVGVWEAEKFKQNLKGLTKENSLRRKMYEANHKTYNSLQDAVQGTLTDLASVYNTVTQDRDYVYKVVDGTKIVKIENPNKDPNAPKEELTDGAKRMVKRVMGNKEVKDTLPNKREIIQGTAHTGKMLANEKITELQMQHRAKEQAKAEKRGSYHHQSTWDFIKGTNSDKNVEQRNVNK